MMFGRELHLPDQLPYNTGPLHRETSLVYMAEVQRSLQAAHQHLRQQNQDIRAEGSEKHHFFRLELVSEDQ